MDYIYYKNEKAPSCDGAQVGTALSFTGDAGT